MSELTYKKIIDVETVEALNDGATVFVNDNGAMKQVGADKFGAVKTVNGVAPDENGNIVVEVPEIPEPVQPDWNQNDPNAPDYVKNRTHYKERSTLFSGEVTVTNGMGVLPIQKYVEGESYTVLFDGAEYNCVAFTASLGGVVCIGDEKLAFDPEQSDVKFPFLCVGGKIVARDGVHDVTVVGSGYRTISHEYLPKCIVYSNRTRNDTTGNYYVMYKDKECSQPVVGVDRDIASFLENGMPVVVYDVNTHAYYHPNCTSIVNNRIVVRYIGTDDSSGNFIDCAVMSESQRPS